MSTERYDDKRCAEVRAAAQVLEHSLKKQHSLVTTILTSKSASITTAAEAADAATREATLANEAHAAGRAIEAASHRRSAEANLAIALAFNPLDPLLGRGNLEAEWKECRSSIDRFDKLLVELRKTGFGFATVLVTAAAALQIKQSGAPTGPSTLEPGQNELLYLLAFGAFAILTVMLYISDRVHSMWLREAVARAKELETKLGFELTYAISGSTKPWAATAVGFAIYSALLAVACAIFWVPMGSHGSNDDLTNHKIALLGVTASAILVCAIAVVLTRSKQHSDT